MNFDHILKFAGVLALIALLSYLGPLGYLANTAIVFAGLWKLTA
jgi:hypothetical protein